MDLFPPVPAITRFKEASAEVAAQSTALEKQVRDQLVSTTEARSAYADVIRRVLVKLVEASDLLPEQAEDAFGALDHGRLLEGGNGVDPFEKRHWGVLALLAWIIWRRPDEVRSFDVAHQRLQREWRWSGTGWVSTRRESPTIEALAKAAASTPEAGRRYMTLTDAARALLSSLTTGKIRVCASDGHSRVILRPHEFVSADTDELFGARLVRPSAQAQFYAIDFYSDGALREWKDNTPKESAVLACTKILAEIIAQSPERRTHSKAALLAACHEAYPKLTMVDFERARTAAIKNIGAVAWQHPGAPRKSSEKSIERK